MLYLLLAIFLTINFGMLVPHFVVENEKTLNIRRLNCQII